MKSSERCRKTPEEEYLHISGKGGSSSKGGINKFFSEKQGREVHQEGVSGSCLFPKAAEARMEAEK